MPAIPGYGDIEAAAGRIAACASETPVVGFPELNEHSGLNLVFKCENLQEAGSFKARGASNAVKILEETGRCRGVVTHSSGNHGAALAYAAGRAGIRSTVIMPRSAVAGKKRLVAGYGGHIIECANSASARSMAVKRFLAEADVELVHPYDDPRVIAGQGTCFREFAGQAGRLDAVVVPVGGGGLLSGTCIAARALAPDARVFAAEPELADDAYRSLQAGKLVKMDTSATIADGLRAPVLESTWRIMSAHVESVLTVGEVEIVEAMGTYRRYSGRWIEPSSAVALAAVLKNRARFSGLRVGIILTGGNVDIESLPEWARRMLAGSNPRHAGAGARTPDDS